MKTFDYAGKTWEYDDDTVIIIELGRYMNKYRDHKSYAYDDLGVAIEYYENFNVSDGYKKRLSIITSKGKTSIIHQTSKRIAK